jgi:hypothetical protein
MDIEASVIDLQSLGNAACQSVLFLAAALTAFALVLDVGLVIPARFARANAAGFAKRGLCRFAFAFSLVVSYTGL